MSSKDPYAGLRRTARQAAGLTSGRQSSRSGASPAPVTPKSTASTKLTPAEQARFQANISSSATRAAFIASAKVAAERAADSRVNDALHQNANTKTVASGIAASDRKAKAAAVWDRANAKVDRVKPAGHSNAGSPAAASAASSVWDRARAKIDAKRSAA